MVNDFPDVEKILAEHLRDALPGVPIDTSREVPVLTDQLPQPREGITGIDRTGDPLVSLEDDVVPIRDLIGALARQLYSATGGNTHPLGRSVHERVTHPQPGDRVVVLDSVWRPEWDSYRGVGYLIEHRAEWWTSDEEWAREVADGEIDADEPRPVERHAWYVQYGPAPADVCRWVNCDVIAVPGPGERWDR